MPRLDKVYGRGFRGSAHQVSQTDSSLSYGHFLGYFQRTQQHCLSQIRLDFSGLLPRECSWRMRFMDALSLEKTKFEDKADFNCDVSRTGCKSMCSYFMGAYP